MITFNDCLSMLQKIDSELLEDIECIFDSEYDYFDDHRNCPTLFEESLRGDRIVFISSEVCLDYIKKLGLNEEDGTNAIKKHLKDNVDPKFEFVICTEDYFQLYPTEDENE